MLSILQAKLQAARAWTHTTTMKWLWEKILQLIHFFHFQIRAGPRALCCKGSGTKGLPVLWGLVTKKTGMVRKGGNEWDNYKCGGHWWQLVPRHLFIWLHKHPNVRLPGKGCPPRHRHTAGQWTGPEANTWTHQPAPSNEHQDRFLNKRGELFGDWDVSRFHLLM